jgi:hypothetical protein
LADDQWLRLIRWATTHDYELGATLKTFREMGRHLVRRDGRIELVPADSEDAAEYARDRDYLLPHAAWLSEALGELAGVVGEVPIERT